MLFRWLLITLVAIGLTAMLLGGCGDDPTGPVARVKATDPQEVRR